MDKLVSNKFVKQEKEFLADVEIDYVALSEVVGMCLGHYKAFPTEEEYLYALDFLKYLMDKYGDRLKCEEGPGTRDIKMSLDLINWLREMWYAGKYKEIDYGIWFNLEFTKSQLVFLIKRIETSYKNGKINALPIDEALSFVELAKRLGVEVSINKGHPSTFWDIEYLTIGVNGYHIPILPE